MASVMTSATGLLPMKPTPTQTMASKPSAKAPVSK